MTIRSWTDAEVTTDANLTEMRESQAKARAYGREIVRLRELIRGLESLAVAVMDEHDEETTGSVTLDNFINGVMAAADDVRPPRGKSRLEKAEATADMVDGMLGSLGAFVDRDKLRQLHSAPKPAAMCPSNADGIHRPWHDEGAEDLCRCGKVIVDGAPKPKCATCGGRERLPTMIIGRSRYPGKPCPDCKAAP